MPDSFGDRLRSALQHGWNAFNGRLPTNVSIGASSENRGLRSRYTRGNERSIVASIYTRIAMDVAALTINHVRLDEDGRYSETIKSSLNECLTLTANKDQTGRAFIQDVVMSMLDEGVIAIVPVDTTLNPMITGSYDIESMRVARITDWYPDHVRVELYNDRTGKKQEVTLPKSMVAIVENPLYSVMNEPNSTLMRLKRKLNLLDIIDDRNGSDKLDMIIQLPFAVKGEIQKKRAEDRLDSVKSQLSKSDLGIAYIDATERITQLNRPIESNLLKTVEYLTNMLYGQLGLSQAIMDGTADEKQMLNYNNRTVEPIVSAIVDAMKWKFLTKTARSQGQSIMFFRDPFKLVPVENVAEIADKFTRNEIMTSNEFRQVIGMKPSDDPKADELRNANISAPNEEPIPVNDEEFAEEQSEESASGGEEKTLGSMTISELMR